MKALRPILLTVAVLLLIFAGAVAALTYVWPHFPPFDWEAYAPQLMEGAGGLAIMLLAVWGLTRREILPFPLNDDG